MVEEGVLGERENSLLDKYYRSCYSYLYTVEFCTSNPRLYCNVLSTLVYLDTTYISVLRHGGSMSLINTSSFSAPRYHSFYFPKTIFYHLTLSARNISLIRVFKNTRDRTKPLPRLTNHKFHFCYHIVVFLILCPLIHISVHVYYIYLCLMQVISVSASFTSSCIFRFVLLK